MYSSELKLEIVQRYLEGKIGLRTLASEYKVAKGDIQKWRDAYLEHGVSGLCTTHGTYTGDFKISVVEYMHDNHLSLFQTAVKFGIPQDHTVGKWERIYYEEGPQALYRDNRGRKPKMSSDKPKKTKLDKQTEEDLIAEVQRLRMENEYLKKLNALVQERIARENGKESPSSMN